MSKGNALKSVKLDEEIYQGLTDSEVKIRRNKYGSNIIENKKKISPGKIFVNQFKDLMVLILIVSTVISALMGEIVESITMILIIVINALFGFIQEYRTEKTIEAIKKLATSSAKVIRNGISSTINAIEVVPGDLVMVEAGDRIPADAVLIKSSYLQVDESLLTGESLPVEKSIANLKPKKHDQVEEDQERIHTIFMGTIVTNGKASAMVVSTGMNTEMGSIAQMLQNIDEEQTPLQRKLQHLGTFIAVWCLIICAVVSTVGILRGESLFVMLLAGISLAVAAVPEGLPAVVTIALAMGVQKMSKKNTLIRKLPAVETLGCATVICSDKTGTLTQNKMSVKKIYAEESLVEIQDDNFFGNGELKLKGRKSSPLETKGIKLTLEIGVLCNNAELIEIQHSNITSKIKNIVRKKEGAKKERFVAKGDATECALLLAAKSSKMNVQELNENFNRIKEIPFNADRKCMSVICVDNNKNIFVFAKGAPEVIIKKCTKIHTSQGITKLKPGIASGLMQVNNRMAKSALRVLAVGYRRANENDIEKDDIENDLVFVGLIGMIDPPRIEAAQAVAKCKLAGIRPIMITGDHKITASVIAGELGIHDGSECGVLIGEDIDKMSDVEFQQCVGKTSVYARVMPRHKLAIVRALKNEGHIVAMTGDGVNDAPAIKEADIGISMGESGTDVTKEASSMILLDDNFATIVSAVEEGRIIYGNIRKFIRYMFTCNIGEVVTMFIGMIMGLPLPLLPIQILWVNLVTDGLPAIALGVDPADKDIMLRPPRMPKETIFSGGLLRIVIFRGILIGVTTLAVFMTILNFSHGNIMLARTAAFVTLIITQLIHAFECKSETKSIFEVNIPNNIFLIISVLCSLLMMLGVIYVPILQSIFKTVKLALKDWILVLGFSGIGPALSSLFKFRKHKRLYRLHSTKCKT